MPDPENNANPPSILHKRNSSTHENDAQRGPKRVKFTESVEVNLVDNIPIVKIEEHIKTATNDIKMINRYFALHRKAIEGLERKNIEEEIVDDKPEATTNYKPEEQSSPKPTNNERITRLGNAVAKITKNITGMLGFIEKHHEYINEINEKIANNEQLSPEAKMPDHTSSTNSNKPKNRKPESETAEEAMITTSDILDVLYEKVRDIANDFNSAVKFIHPYTNSIKELKKKQEERTKPATLNVGTKTEPVAPSKPKNISQL